jgi:hypothetical protein
MDAVELGYLLRELERQDVIAAERVERCCNRIFARSYRYQGRHLLWVAGHLGYTQSGITPIPPVAREITASMGPGYLYTTICRECGHGLHLFLDGPLSITVIRGLPPTFATVRE